MKKIGVSFIAAILILTFLLIISGCNRQESVDSNYILKEEDFFIKGLYYQADSATVIKAVGSPDSIKAVKPYERYPGGLSIWKYPDFELIFNHMNALIGIRVIHVGFLTTKGLGVGDSLNRVWELYGHSDKDNGLPYQSFYYCVNLNDTTCIAITTENGIVKKIYVGQF